MSTEAKLIAEIIRAKYVLAKREHDLCCASQISDKVYLAHWDGQQVAFKQLLDILDS